MKNFIIIIISLVIISVFIGLNYVLWDRESLQNEQKFSNTSIRKLSETIDQMESTNNNLKEENDRLNEKITQQETEKSELSNHIEGLNQIVSDKNEAISMFKALIDIVPFREIIINWTDLVTMGKYSEAYKILTGDCTIFQNEFTLYEFERYFSNVTYIGFAQMSKVNDEESTNSEKTTDISDDKDTTDTSKQKESIAKEASKEASIKEENIDEKEILIDLVEPLTGKYEYGIAVKTTLYIDIAEGKESELLKQGNNVIYFEFEYSREYDKWFISRIIHE